MLTTETLRKWSPASNLVRLTKNDYRVPGTEIVIDKGTSVQIPVKAIHMDPEYYPNPGNNELIFIVTK